MRERRIADAAPSFVDRLADAEVVVVGPTPPLRGGIAAHTAALVEYLQARGVAAAAVSYRRLYPAFVFPGRAQRTRGTLAPWSEEGLDVLDPRTWWSLGRRLQRSDAQVVLQWWHPVVAPALLAATSGLAAGRLVAVCHNVLPHERLPGARLAARATLARCGRVVCHSSSEAAVASRLLPLSRITTVGLPCLVSSLEPAPVPPPELSALGAGARILIAAGHPRSYKGTWLLVEAWGRARRPSSGRLLLVGESYLRGAEHRRVSLAAKADPSIVIVDRYVEDEELVLFLASSELLVAAYRRASQSGLIPIALALGLPCLVSDAGGLAEQVASGAGPQSTVVRAGDVGALAQAIERHFDSTQAQPVGSLVRTRTATHADAGTARFDQWQDLIEAMGVGGRP